MDVYTTEEQQVEAIKKWWKENGKAVVIGAIIGLGGLYGWRYYQAEQDQQMERASDAYVQVVEAMTTKQADADLIANQFVAENDSAYADLIELQLAKKAVEAGDLNKALTYLRAVQSSHDEVLTSLATLRIARLEIQMDQLDQAMDELNGITSKSWAAQVDELKGDIALRQGNTEKAREFFVSSIAVSPNPAVQMKLDNLSK